MKDTLTLEELSQGSGATVEDLCEWRSLGLIGSDDDTAYTHQDMERVRFIQLLRRRGISTAAIAKADAERGFFRRYIAVMFPEGVSPAWSFAEAALEIGMHPDLFRTLWHAAQVGGEQESIEARDIEALKALKVIIDEGVPEEALKQLVRVYADALSRVAETEVRLFHFYVHERLQARGLSLEDLWAATDAARQRAVQLIEPLILYFHRKGFARAVREDAVVHMRDEAGLVERSEVLGQLWMAIVFVDLSSFTPLTEAMGDEVAAEILQRFSWLVRQAVARSHGRVVKQIGDAFMLVFPEPHFALACALEIERYTAEEPQFPAARSGIHWGQVLYREGDYVGTSVNVAARLATQAQRHQVIVSGAVRKEAGSASDMSFVSLGKRRLKGIGDELELFLVEPRVEHKAKRRLIDTVCGMELDNAEVAVRLALEGHERVFCSQTCLQRFVEAPERYPMP